MAEYIPKTEVQWWLVSLKDLILKEQESGVIDMAVIKELLNSIMRKVADY